MSGWLTPTVAVALMYAGVLPSLGIVYLLYEERQRPGVLWFLVLMATAAAWSLLYGTFTLVSSPALTLALANVFWAVVPTAAVATFLLAYEYVFRTVASRRLVAALFVPVAVLFVLSWPNPDNLVFTPDYRVGPDGVLYVPPLGGPVKILVTKVYGYLLTAFAAGIFLGEALGTSGTRRRQTMYLLLIFVALAITTVVKIAGLVPEYYDLTSTAYSVAGLAFAYSVRRHDLLRFGSVAREQAFEAVEDIVLVLDPGDVVVEVNRAGREFFGGDVVGTRLDALLTEPDAADASASTSTTRIDGAGGQRHVTRRSSPITYGRGVQGRLVVLNDVTALERRREELGLLTQIMTRLFRHDMRNDLNAIEGYASRIPANEDEEVERAVGVIRDRARRLQGEAEKVRELERVFDYEGAVRLSLRDTVDRALAPFEARSDVVVTSSVDDVVVAAHPRLAVAVSELVENAITHYESPETPEITVSSSVAAGEVTLVVADDGPGVPQAEIDVLDAGEETTLRHSSGIGLWLVKLIVTRGDGDLAIESDTDGTRVEIRLPVAEGDGEEPS